MCEVTFTPKQVREIRRRIEAVPFAGRHHAEPDIYRADVLAAFPLPKVTRYRTFTSKSERDSEGEYRIKDGRVEYRNRWGKESGDDFLAGNLVSSRIEDVARTFAEDGDWAALAALADVAARPTEEVPDDGR